LIFDLEKLVKVGKVYDLETVIPTKFSPYSIKDSQLGDGGDGSDGSIKGEEYSKQNMDVRRVNSSSNNNEKSNEFATNTANTTTYKDSEDAPSSQEPSQLSLPSPSSPSTTDISKSIYRLGHSDIWTCKNCK
jgi:hypothetical protein